MLFECIVNGELNRCRSSSGRVNDVLVDRAALGGLIFISRRGCHSLSGCHCRLLNLSTFPPNVCFKRECFSEEKHPCGFGSTLIFVSRSHAVSLLSTLPSFSCNHGGCPCGPLIGLIHRVLPTGEAVMTVQR